VRVCVRNRVRVSVAWYEEVHMCCGCLLVENYCQDTFMYVETFPPESTDDVHYMWCKANCSAG